MREISNVRKIKYMNKVGRKMSPKTKKQIEASRNNGTLVCLIKNPIWDPESKEKMRQKKKGIITSPETLFKPENQFGRLRKGLKHSEETKIFISMKKLGKKHCGTR